MHDYAMNDYRNTRQERKRRRHTELRTRDGDVWKVCMKIKQSPVLLWISHLPSPIMMPGHSSAWATSARQRDILPTNLLALIDVPILASIIFGLVMSAIECISSSPASLLAPVHASVAQVIEGYAIIGDDGIDRCNTSIFNASGEKEISLYFGTVCLCSALWLWALSCTSYNLKIRSLT